MSAPIIGGRRTAWALVVALGVTGCNVGGDPVNRVQTNLVDKSIFEGEWWYAQTAIDVDGDEAAITGIFEGFAASDLAVDVSGQPNEIWRGSYPLGRIRWVIDENFLFAYRSFELVAGANSNGDDPDFLGQPLAVFAIEEHVDVRQEYNPITGETTNVTIEDTDDRSWFERVSMRVDWSQNLISGPFMGRGDFEPTSFFIQEGGSDAFPESWRPSFVRLGEDPDYRFQDEWPEGSAATVHYMSFVTQGLFSPGPNCQLFSGGGSPCSNAAVTMRHAFLRIPPDHGYAAATQTHQEYDRFGTFRTAQRTYLAGGDELLEKRQFCFSSADCGVGGACAFVTFEDGTFPVCTGGLTDNRGETDFLNFFRPRHYVWQNALTDRPCLQDWECDGRFGEFGGDLVGQPGSQCDPAARRCTVPLEARAPRQVTYTLSAGFPRHLIGAAFRSVGDWNEVFMRGFRVTQEEPLPSGPPQSCQTDNPTAYCFCDSPEVTADGTCPYRYDPFESPESAAEAGVTNAYRCHVVAPAEPSTPTSYDDYGTEVYNTRFEGDECRFVLEPNRCDQDPGQPCQELGDLRYQFYNYIDHGSVFFGGVAVPLVDPTTGELVHSNVNVAAKSVEDVATTAREFFPVLRDEPQANDSYVEGENLRSYFARRGNTQSPVSALEASAYRGFLSGDLDRPGLPTDMHALVMERLEGRRHRLERLQGIDGRASILTDRLQALRGTAVEQNLLASAGRDGWDAIFRTSGTSQLPAARLSDPASLQATSLLSSSSAEIMPPTDYERRRAEFPAGLAFDPPFAPDVESARFGWWAEAFRGRSLEEASIRMEQKYLEGVMHHELGHGVGLTHNFGASFDRNQYHDAYFETVLADDEALAIPRAADFDEPAQGGNGDGDVTGEELNRYFAALRTVRDERSARGLGRFTTSSVMDYHGDLGIMSGLGRYDVAATLWNYFDQVEVYAGDPRHASTGSLAGILRSDNTAREWWRSYRGGEGCSVNEDCPFGPDNPQMLNQGVFQRCIVNPRQAPLPQPCNGAENCICSTFDEDMLDFQAGISFCGVVGGTVVCDYNPDPDGDGIASHFAVPYRFCSDFRTHDISWCTRGDAGESFQEAVDHYRRSWEQAWPLAYNRRFRAAGPTSAGTAQGIQDVVKIYQHFFFRFFFEPGFQNDLGPLGVDDQFLASADAMNWLTEIVTLPQPGTYQLDTSDNLYRLLSTDPAMPGGDVSLPLGAGYPMFSSYQDGFNGFFRVEQSGVFWDKYLALLGLARRDWNLSFTVDERFFINFYDLFPLEMTEFFGGLILDDPSWYAPRLEVSGASPQITPLTWFRGSCPGPDGFNVPCRGAQTEVFPEAAIGGTSNEILRAWATILALAQFPVYFDPTFEQRLVVFRRGTGAGFQIPDVQADGEPSCAFGNVTVDPSHVTGCDDPDYVVYEAGDQQQYLAVKVRSRQDFNLEEEMLGFQLLSKLVTQREERDALRQVPSPSEEERARLQVLERTVRDGESFLLYLIDIQERYGISAFFL